MTNGTLNDAHRIIIVSFNPRFAVKYPANIEPKTKAAAPKTP